MFGPGRTDAPVPLPAPSTQILVQAQLQAPAARVACVLVEAVANVRGVRHDGVLAAELVQRRVQTDARGQQGAPAHFHVVVSGRIQFGNGGLTVQLADFGRCEAHAQVAVQATAGADRVGSAQLGAEFGKTAHFVGSAEVGTRGQVVFEVVADAVVTSTGHDTNLLGGAEFQLCKSSIVGNTRTVVAHTTGVGNTVQGVAHVTAGGDIAHDGQVVRHVIVLAAVNVNTRDQTGTQPDQFLLVLHVHTQRLHMVVVQGAFAACARAPRDRVIGQLAVVIVAGKQRHRGQAALSGFAFPGQIGAGGFVFAPGEGVDAFARVGTEVVFKQTARRVRVQIRVHQRGAQPRLVAQVVVATQCERVFFATAVLLPVVGIALRAVV